MPAEPVHAASSSSSYVITVRDGIATFADGSTIPESILRRSAGLLSALENLSTAVQERLDKASSPRTSLLDAQAAAQVEIRNARSRSR